MSSRDSSKAELPRVYLDGRASARHAEQAVRGTPTESVLLTSKAVTDQVEELRRAGYSITFDEPTRCSNCNGVLEEAGSDEDTPEHAPPPDDTTVWRCRGCGQAFWKGSHWDDVRRRLGAGADDSRKGTWRSGTFREDGR